MKSDVYFSSIKGQSREDCFKTLLNRADTYFSQFKKGSFVGIKMTVGDEKNIGYIKPGLVRILVDNLKGREVKPFVFDTNVIYKGQRQNSVDHLNLAYRKGFTPDKIGCPYIIADSVFGTDSKIVKVESGNIKEIKVPSLMTVLKDVIVLSHVTGHIMTGFAGSVKNVAMGMASRAGKQIQHSSMKPSVSTANCTACGCCIETCPANAISDHSGRVFINTNLCIGCGECIACCKFDAVKIKWREDADVFVERMAEYARGILLKIERKVFVNFAFDITEECDCISGDDPVITEDTGIFISGDILAADKACYDMLTRSGDIFSRNKKIEAHLHLFKYAGEIGLGNLNYDLVEL